MSMNGQLPPGQERILHCFADAEDEGRQASRAEIANICGYAFPSAVSKHVEALVRKGLLDADREKKRNVKLTESGWASIQRTPANLGVPVLGSIAAGSPILAVEHHDSYLSEVVTKPGRFALKVRGESMIEAGINDGDFAILDAKKEVANGTIAAVLVDEETTLKVVRQRSKSMVLEPCNKDYEPIVVTAKNSANCQVLGELAFIIRPMHGKI